MRRSVKLASFLLLLGAAAAIALPASAEFDSQKRTDWGVQTKGNSNTIGQWAALAWEVDQVHGTIFVGGNFLDVTNRTQVHRQPYLAAFDADTGAWQSWFRPEVGSAVFAMQPTPDGGLLVGGEIGSWNGQTVGSLVKIDPATGDRWPGFPTRLFGGNSVVRDLKLEADGYVYAVGSFPQANDGGGSFSVGGAVRFDPSTGIIDRSWTPSLTDGAAWGVSRSKTQDTTYIAGFFQGVNGDDTTVRGFVGLDDNGAVVTDRSVVPFNGCTAWAYCSQMYDVETTTAGHIWVAGVEHALYVIDESDGSLVKHHYTACDPARNNCNGLNWVGGEFQEIEQTDDRIYAACHCWHDLYSDTRTMLHRFPTGSHDTVKAIAAFDPVTADVIPSFNPELRGDSGGFGIHLNTADGCLWVAGGFSSYGSPGGPQPPADDVVRICDEAGPGPGAPTNAAPPAPLDCLATSVGNAVTVNWQSDDTATSTVIYRRVDGGGIYWNGRVEAANGSTFTTTAPGNSQTGYYALHTYPAGQRSATVPCGVINLLPNLTPASACTATVGADNSVVVAWTAGSDNADYIVRRSVDGSPNYWRARVDATSYTDTAIQLGRSYTFTVTARDSNRTTTEVTDCGGPITIQAPGPDVIASCSANLAPDNSVTLEWADGANTDRYIIRRTRDGSTNWWRARVESIGGGAPLQWTETTLVLGSSYTFSVEAIGTDGTVTAATPCGGTFEPVPDEVPAIVSCTVTGSTIEWTYPAAGPNEAIVERQRTDIGTWGWTARTAETTYTDTRVQPGIDYAYRVLAITPNGTRSGTTECV